jgi:Fe-S-cluster containining protein
MATSNGNQRFDSRSLRVLYNCAKCPAYCCSYEYIEVTRRDIARLARHFGITYEQAEQRMTKPLPDARMLRHKKDRIFKSVCRFLDSDTRTCTVYDARPAVCRHYPESARCGYYDFLAAERRRQCDDEFIPSA